MRLFVGIDVGDEVRAEVSRVSAALRAAIERAAAPPRVVWVAPGALHVTLRFLGEVADADLASVCRVIEPPVALDPFHIEWRGLGAFPGPRQPRALWMGLVDGAASLGRVEAEVSRRLGGVATPTGDLAALRPHVTIARVKTAGAGVDWPALLGEIDVRGARTRVGHLTLYRSQLSPRGPHYTVVMKTPLVGA